jgi:hypothetical protein
VVPRVYNDFKVGNMYKDITACRKRLIDHIDRISEDTGTKNYKSTGRRVRESGRKHWKENFEIDAGIRVPDLKT